MKSYRMLFAIVLTIIIMLFVVLNVYLLNSKNESGREYKVQIERLCTDISDDGRFDMSDYPMITAVIKSDGSREFLYGVNSDYVIRNVNGELYRIEYSIGMIHNSGKIIFTNMILTVMTLLILSVMLFVGIKIIVPFERIKNMPYELSRGNLTVPLKESRSKFFGRFTWGLDLLREKLEQQKLEELKLQKEKKTLLLSLSHDIKTPLSAIKLYSQALSKHLYSDKEMQLAAIRGISTKADEIENYVSQIVKATTEDFLSIEVVKGEFYLHDLIDKIKEYYFDKLELNKIDFFISDFSDCILKGDLDRSVEVLQNIIENAVKYGNGNYIRIDFSDEENCRLITVSNSGSALPDNEMTHIFDSFWRGSNAENVNGSGLGLYICRQIMNKMGGEIFAETTDECMLVTSVFEKA